MVLIEGAYVEDLQHVHIASMEICLATPNTRSPALSAIGQYEKGSVCGIK